jgi:LysR family glycine cleavage system transcriptional activator
MIPTLPLNALRAFEAAARLGSMTAAARELSVTPGAVSQQIALLESRLGVRLLQRLGRSLELTEPGRSYFPPLRGAFRQIEEATRRVAATSEARALTISAPPAFAASWLVPRLGDYQTRHPEVDLRIVTGRALVDFETGEVDVAIRHGLGRWKGLRADRVATVQLIAVCSKTVLAGRALSGSADLASLPLLHDAARRDWPLWFQAHGVYPLPKEALAGPSFDDQMLLIQAAVAGQGVALVSEVLARRELKRRELVKAIDLAWPDEFAYWLVSPLATAGQPKIAAFRDWLLTQAEPLTLPQPRRSSASNRSSWSRLV